MTPVKPPAALRFVVEVVFSNAGTVYGIETYAVDAADRAAPTTTPASPITGARRG